jgi:hypothetical protein
MSLSLNNIFSKQNVNLVVGLITLLFVMWGILFAVPSLFYYLFNTTLGIIIIICFLFLAAMYDMSLALGLAIVVIILYRYPHMKLEHFII